MELIYRKSIYFLIVGFLIICSAMCSGCDSKKMTDPKGELETRSSEYWNMRLIEKNYNKTYDMEAEKKSLPYDKYKNQIFNAGQINYVSIAIEDVKIENGKGSLVAMVKCLFPQMTKPVSLSIPDQWVVQENQWMHVLPKK